MSYYESAAAQTLFRCQESRGLYEPQLEVGARRAPRLLVPMYRFSFMPELMAAKFGIWMARSTLTCFAATDPTSLVTETRQEMVNSGRQEVVSSTRQKLVNIFIKKKPAQVVEEVAAEQAKKRDTATGPATVMVEVSKSNYHFVESSNKVAPQLAEKLVSLTPGADWAMFAKVNQFYCRLYQQNYSKKIKDTFFSSEWERLNPAGSNCSKSLHWPSQGSEIKTYVALLSLFH